MFGKHSSSCLRVITWADTLCYHTQQQNIALCLSENILPFDAPRLLAASSKTLLWETNSTSHYSLFPSLCNDTALAAIIMLWCLLDGGGCSYYSCRHCSLTCYVLVCWFLNIWAGNFTVKFLTFGRRFYEWSLFIAIWLCWLFLVCPFKGVF